MLYKSDRQRKFNYKIKVSGLSIFIEIHIKRQISSFILIKC